MMFGIKEDIKKAILKKGVARELEAVLACNCGQRALNEVFGKNKTSWFKAARYLTKTKTLEVLLGGSVNPQAIRAQTKKIINKANKIAGECYIESIRFRLE